MNGHPRVFVHGVTAEEWSARYGIEVFKLPVLRVRTNVHDLDPLRARNPARAPVSPCPCGNEKTPFGLVRDPKHGDLFTGTEVSTPCRKKKAP